MADSSTIGHCHIYRACYIKLKHKINTYMFKWLVNTYMKHYINELVDERLKNRMFERYYESKQQELKDRIAKVRQSFYSQTQGIQEDKQTEVLSSGDIRRREKKSRVPSETDQASLKRNNELNDIKAKLMGKKT